MPWSTSAVFGETLERLAAAARLVHVLPECIDADTKEDLIMLLRQQESGIASSRALSLLMGHLRGMAE